MSSKDLLFSLAVEKLPKQLASAMIDNGLMHPAVLSHYPRKSAEELGLVQAQEAKMRKIIEGDIEIAAIAATGSIGYGWYRYGSYSSRECRWDRVPGDRVLISGAEQRDGCCLSCLYT